MKEDDLLVLVRLVEDAEHKWGDPHTLRAAREVVNRLSSAQPATREWIPVGERLPSNKDAVVCINKNGVLALSWYDGTGYWALFNPTHWMPLPPPPAADK